MFSFLFIHTPLKYLTEGLWRDEAFSYLLAKHSFGEIIVLTVKDFNPPLYYFVLHMWMIWFGTSEIALRSLSFLFYAIGVFCVYEIFKVILNKSHRLALVCTILFVFNPLVLYYAFEARMYSMFFCLAMASSYYYLKKDWRNYTIVSVLGFYTHYFMALVILTQFIHTIIFLPKKTALSLVWQAIKPFVLTSLLFLPWAIFFFVQHRSIPSQFWISYLSPAELRILPSLTFSGIGLGTGGDFNINTHPGFALLTQGFTLFFVIVSLLGWYSVRHKKIEQTVYFYFICLTIIPIIAVLLVSQKQPLYLPRYLIFASASISLLLILAIIEMKKILRIVFLVIFIFLCFQFQTIQLEYRARGSLKKIIEKIKPLANPGDLIYVTSEVDYMTAQYYFGDQVYIYGRKYEDIPSYVGKVLIPSNAIRITYPTFPQKAFVIVQGTNTYEVHSQFPL